MMYLVICAVALLASALTLFSGFGLGTLLLPTFAFFFPVEQAVALTAIVHLLTNLFKGVLVGRYASWRVVKIFGLSALLASLAGAMLLVWLSEALPLFSYSAFGREISVLPVKLVVGAVLVVFAALEVLPKRFSFEFEPRFMAMGGVLSGFFGGLSGMQGALRAAFLSRAGLEAKTFIGTGVIIACLVDLSRLTVYVSSFRAHGAHLNYSLLGAAVLSAFLGAVIGARYVTKVTMPVVQRIVATLLFVCGVGMCAGLL